MARPERLELPTYWFEASRSIHLSYGRAPSYRLDFNREFTLVRKRTKLRPPDPARDRTSRDPRTGVKL